VLEEVFRDEWGRVLASLVGFLGDFDKAEEAAQEAYAIAAERWPVSGVPPNPGGWLVTTARNRAIDRIRRERTLAEKIHLLPVPEVVMDEFDDTVIKDERLELSDNRPRKGDWRSCGVSATGYLRRRCRVLSRASVTAAGPGGTACAAHRGQHDLGDAGPVPGSSGGQRRTSACPCRWRPHRRPCPGSPAAP
jgi:Sigma-70 region 2